MEHEDLIELGFRLCGVEENDPFYKLVFRPPFKFNISSLNGVIDEGSFWLYGNDIKYTDKIILKNLIEVLGNEIYNFEN